MTPAAWDAAIQRIELKAKEDGYAVRVRLIDGTESYGVVGNRDGDLIPFQCLPSPQAEIGDWSTHYLALEHIIWIKQED